MTGPDGDLSSPAPLLAETEPSSGSFAVPYGKSWKCGLCATSGTLKLFRSPRAVYGHLHIHKGRPKQQAEGGKKKRKNEESYALGKSQSCSPSGKQFKSHQARRGTMRVHNDQPQRQMPPVHGKQDKEVAGILLQLGRCHLNKMEGRETKGDGSAVAEGGASLSKADALRKQIHMNLDLNKDPQKHDETETKGDGSAVAEGGASLSEADTRRKQIHMNLVAPEGA